MKWVGLTGGIASGKSSVAEIIRAQGVPVLDADAEAHQALVKSSPVLSQIVAKFGPGILNAQGDVDRARLGSIVFSDPQKILALENIVHPFVQAQIQKKREELERVGTPLVFYDVPLLFEKNLQSQFDAVVVVSCAPDVQLQRLMKRNHLSTEQAEQRIRLQLPLVEKSKKADYVIENNSTLEDLKKSVLKVLNKI